MSHRGVLSLAFVRPATGAYLWAGLTLCYPALVSGAPPITSLRAPLYSFDLDSPHVFAGDELSYQVGAGDVLAFQAAPEQAAVYIPAAALGMLNPQDELDGLSGANNVVTPADSFSLLLSVDRNSVGNNGPDAAAIALSVPYNPLDQAGKMQAAGDQFMSLRLCTRQQCELAAPGQGGRALLNNTTLVRNNYNEGGTGLAGCPDDPASGGSGTCTFSRGRVTGQDDVDAMAGTGVDMTAPGTAFYFSVSTSSPSLGPLSQPAAPSGANIFYNADPLSGISTTTVYATSSNLGLVASDDIDALIVFDDDADGVFDGTDTVLFSLVPDSASLSTITGASVFGSGADIFRVVPGGDPTLYTAASHFGLADQAGTLDNIDGLDFFLCDDALGCASQHGIRAGNIPAASTWGLVILTALVLAAGSVLARRIRTA